MDEQSKTRLFSPAVSYFDAAPNMSAPQYSTSDLSYHRSCMHSCLDAILVPLEETLFRMPHIASDPSAFYRLSVSHGFPALSASDDERGYETPRQRSIRQISRQTTWGQELIAAWKSLSPLNFIRIKAESHNASEILEPFAPGPLRKIRLELTPIRDQLGFEIIRNTQILEDPIAFLKLCIRLGYTGPGSERANWPPNDLTRALGKRLISAWRLSVID
jgi:hypothetical protein